MPILHDPEAGNGSVAGSTAGKKKRKNHRAGKKRKGQKRTTQDGEDPLERTRPSQTADRPPFYRAYQSDNLNLSGTSLDSDALLDHREHQPMRQRRDSRAAREGLSSTMNSSFFRRRGSRPTGDADEERSPLLSSSVRHLGPGYGGVKSSASSTASSRRQSGHNKPGTSQSGRYDYDINNPPSRPASPIIGSQTGLGDVLEGEFTSPIERRLGRDNDFVIDIDGNGGESPPNRLLERRHTLAGVDAAEVDVCFPAPDMSEVDPSEAADFGYQQEEKQTRTRQRRRRWPDLEELELWAKEEDEEMMTEGLRARKVREPEYVGGRLRPRRQQWHREPEDAPYRFTYFNGSYGETIHARTISDLRQEGQTFKDLFLPDPVEISEDEDEDEDDEDDYGRTLVGRASRDFSVSRSELSPSAGSRAGTRQSSILESQANVPRSIPEGKQTSGDLTPVNEAPEAMLSAPQPKRYGERPTFWLDVLCPTEAEMKVLSRAFGLHMLTSEDILTQESREKVELFRHYYFIHYRTFEQDINNENYMEPVNMYIVVFREGVITFHFSMTPHPANVRRRIRQLKDYLVLNPDWLSYALIDDITDAYQPVIESIEERVDEIDDAILEMHRGDESDDESEKRGSMDEKASIRSDDEPEESGGHMLRRVGKIRKKVMKLGRLLGTKADVIKGFAKRCNEQWDIAPRSDIGMFLGDIQDHILTMQSSLSHYEMLLSRAHSNYLAQINIRMNERQEETSGSLNKLTVLGTIVLPMNIITGMWGMNVKVPGQDIDSLDWFFCITAGLFLFGGICWALARYTRLA